MAWFASFHLLPLVVGEPQHKIRSRSVFMCQSYQRFFVFHIHGPFIQSRQSMLRVFRKVHPYRLHIGQEVLLLLGVCSTSICRSKYHRQFTCRGVSTKHRLSRISVRTAMVSAQPRERVQIWPLAKVPISPYRCACIMSSSVFVPVICLSCTMSPEGTYLAALAEGC